VPCDVREVLRCSKAECSLRVVRAQLDDGRRMIGVRFPPVLIALAEKMASEETRVRQQLTVVDISLSLLSLCHITVMQRVGTGRVPSLLCRSVRR